MLGAFEKMRAHNIEKIRSAGDISTVERVQSNPRYLNDLAIFSSRREKRQGISPFRLV
jgi:hypothetical protein